MTELIQIKQLPIIEERLREFKERADATAAQAMALVCTEETLQAVKATRADLNRQFGALEAQRKEVKAVLMAPIDQFEAVYKECVGDAFRRADADLKAKIADVEGDMKRRCEEGLRAYFDELCTLHRVDFVPFERVGITISLTDAKAKTQPPRKLVVQMVEFMDRIAADVEAISAMDGADEIMAEYAVSLNTAKAVMDVKARHQRIEAERAARAAREEAQAREAEAVKKVEAFAPPVAAPAEPEPPKLARVTFTITDTKERLRMLKQFLDANGYKYE